MSIIGTEFEWKCRSCDIQFETRGKRDGHQRREHQRVPADDTRDLRTQVEGNPGQGRFVCPCGKTYSTKQSLGRHRMGCSGPIGMVEGFSESSEHEEGTPKIGA